MHRTRTYRPRRTAGRATVALALLPALVLAGCSDDADEAAATTTTRPTATTTTAIPTTTGDPTTAATSTTAAPGVPVRTGGPTVRRDGRPDESGLATVPPDGATPPRDPMTTNFTEWPEYRLAAAANTMGTGTRALGSGCSPADAAHLGDGLWYGYVNGLRDGVVSFDVACWWVGDLRTVAGCEGEADLDSCVLNTSDRERTVPLARDAAFRLPRHFTDPYADVNVDATFDEFAAWLAIPGNTLPVWVRVDRGALVELEAGQQLAG